MTEFSERYFKVAYEVMRTEPAHRATTINGEISLQRISTTEGTFIKWTTDFSNDVDAQIMEDQKFKKLDWFQDMQATLLKK